MATTLTRTAGKDAGNRDSRRVTGLLKAHAKGDKAALQHLVPLVYGELRAIAHKYVSLETRRLTLNTTGLVHEAFLRIDRSRSFSPTDRKHFFALCATVMRHYILDHIRARKASKRGGDLPALPLSLIPEPGVDLTLLLELDDALEKLAGEFPRQAKCVELRFFVGLTHREIADLLGLSEATVRSDWTLARAWLFREMNPNP